MDHSRTLLKADPSTHTQDGSFTLTLFCPRAIIAGIDSRAKASRFFQENFPDAVEWAGEDRLLSDFEDNPRGSLVSINVSKKYTFIPLLSRR